MDRFSYSGRLEMIIGPMFSGKSTELLRKVKRYQIARKNCLVVNYANDNRYSDEGFVATHDKQKLKALKLHKLEDVTPIIEEFDVIAIDEGQFFIDIAEKVELFCNMGKIVLVAALDGTFDRKPFGRILELIPLAEQVQKLSAVCFSCGKDANYTKRLSDCKDIELIGGEEMYKPVCRGCFFNDSDKKQKSFEDLKILEDTNSEDSTSSV